MVPKELEWVWNARWASYETGDKELYQFSEKDFDKKAKKLAQAGVNAVITSGFHFRWSFVHEWPKLSEMLRKIVKSCHKYNIKVVEHHSAVLTHNPAGENEWSQIKKWEINLKHKEFYKGLEDGDISYEGVWLSQMRQIDPRTGQFSHTVYKGWALCPNNPLYQKLYFQYLAQVYKCGVDGIMTDDVQFRPSGYGCGCPYCRKLFTQKTGYKMPPNGLCDKSFYGNMDNPSYRAWLIWRKESTRDHHRRVTNHFRRLGLELCRPFYSSADTTAWAIQGLAGEVENASKLWTTIFTEVLGLLPNYYTWPYAGSEAKHRNALCYREKVPAMCLFYPKDEKENLLCWALTKSWGQCYWGGISEKKQEALGEVFNFEKEHPELYEKPETISEIGILFSSQTRTTYKGMKEEYYVEEWRGWVQTLMRANIQFDVIIDQDLEQKRYFDRFKLLILPNAAHLSKKQISSLYSFVEKGGNLILTYETGMYDETGRKHEKYPLEKLKKYGKGKVLTIPGKPGVKTSFYLESIVDDKRLIKTNYKPDKNSMKLIIDSVKKLYNKPLLETENIHEGILVNIFKHKKELVIHLANVAGTSDYKGKIIKPAKHLNFPSVYSLSGKSSMTLKIRKIMRKAKLFSPEIKEEMGLNCYQKNSCTIVEIPDKYLNCYSAILLEK